MKPARRCARAALGRIGVTGCLKGIQFSSAWIPNQQMNRAAPGNHVLLHSKR